MEEMEDLKFKIGPKSFYQTNPEQAYELYKITREFADLKGDETVYDLYTGTGTIAQFVSKKAKKVVGVEAVQEAIDAANANAERNGITNCTFYCGDMKDIFTDEFIAQNGTPDIIITDPPRDGMHKNVVETILRINPKRIVYVSCNSATQARDLELMKNQYEIKKLSPVDMYPQTDHGENVVLLERISFRNMMKRFWVYGLIFCSLWTVSCEEDDVCVGDGTPALTVVFRNYLNSSNLMDSLTIEADNTIEFTHPDTIYEKTFTDSVKLPLGGLNDNRTFFRIKRRSSSENDILTVHFNPHSAFESKACGY